MMILVLIPLILFSYRADSIRFRQVAILPDVNAWYRVLCFDTDHDGKQNLIFDTNPPNYNLITIWEYNDFDRYRLETSVSSPLPTAPTIYDVGYLDADSLTDMIGNHNGAWPYPLYVYESPSYNSNPTEIVWQDSLFMNIAGGFITDLDQDGMREILFGFNHNSGLRTSIYETIGDNQYSLVWEDSSMRVTVCVNGDFDLDEKLEFITPLPGYPSHIYIWECYGDNMYDSVYYGTLPSPNSIDIFSANDMDGNGKPEFLCTCASYLYGRAYLYLYEAIGDNNYDFIFIDSVIGLPTGMGWSYSACGDVDADGIEEIVWSTFNQWHIYKATGIHQYHKIYSSDLTQFEECKISVCDLNGNGYPEVIESSFQNGIPSLWVTIIWEIEGVHILQPNYGYILHPGEDYQIIWQKFDPPGADSFALSFSSDNGITYDTIALGIPGSDTVYEWVVPDIISDSCWIMVWAYGPPRSGEQQPRGIAWDFGDFKIRPTGIEIDKRYEISDMSLKILQNPLFSGNLKIQYAVPKSSKVKLLIYNVLGQIEQVVVDGEKHMGLYEVEPQESLPSGVYFVKLIVGEKTITKKCIILN